MSTAATLGSAPIQSSTGVSTSAVPENEAGDIALLLLERLDAWKHATGYLEEYVEATAHQHKGWSKDYDKVLKTVSDPLKEGHHFAQSNGGIASLFENIRANTQAISNSHIETEKALKGTVLPQLNRLHQEIKHKHKELGGGVAKDSKAVEKSRGLTQKQIEHLGQNTASFESVGGKIDPANDPYIIQRGVFHHLHKQLMEENNHRKDLIDVQNNFLTFEKHVMQTIQAAMGAFYQTVGGQCDRTKALYGDITTTGQNIPAEFEWSNFLARNGDTLIDPKAPNRTVEMIQFPNQDHASTKPLVDGLLQRKGKIMRSYNTAHYAVTPAGFFHEFQETNDFKEHPEAEMSLYLPDCTVGAPPVAPESKFILSGKDASKSLTTKHEFSFKANSYDEAMRWYDVIQKFSTGALTRQNTLSSTTSPISPTGTNIPPVAQTAGVLGGEKSTAPLDTNVTSTQTMASPSTATPHSATAPTPQSATSEKKHGLFHSKS